MIPPKPALSAGPKVATNKLTRRLGFEEEEKLLIIIPMIKAVLTTMCRKEFWVWLPA